MPKMSKAPHCDVGLTCHLMHTNLKRDEPFNLALRYGRERKRADIFLGRQQPYAAFTTHLTQPGSETRNRTEANQTIVNRN